MTDNPLVSVIIPVHNGAQYVHDAIQSALAQDYSPLEVIAVDDGSTDATPQILARFAGRIHCLRQENLGAAAARNAAIRVARGEYLAFLDADDVWFPDKLRRQVAYLQSHPEVRLLFSRWRLWSGERAHEPPPPGEAQPGGGERVNPEHCGWIYNELLLDCVVHTTTVVMRRELVEKIGLFDEGLRRGQDYDYWLRASRVTPFHQLDAALSAYRLHATNSTWRPLATNFPCLVLERALRLWGRTGPDGRVTGAAAMRKRLAREWFSFGYRHLQAGSYAFAAHAFGRSIASWPLRPRAWLLMLASVLTPLGNQLGVKMARKGS